MRKIFLTAITGTAIALSLNSCNNDEANAKLQAADDAAVLSIVEQRNTELQNEVNTKCATLVDSLANAKFTAWQEEEAKAKPGKKSTPKATPKPKQETPKDTKPKDPKVDVGQKGTENNNKIDVGQKGTENKGKLNVGQKK